MTGTATGGSTLTGDAVVANVLDGKFFYKDDPATKLEGTMPNNAGNVNAVSYHADGTSLHIVPAEGYTDGSDDATVITDSDFTAGNIANGITIFGLEGTLVAGGGGPVEASPKDINLYDYDGVCLYSYTLAEAAALSALPSLPDHSGDDVPLTGQGWNYTLAQAKAVTGRCSIGAIYTPTDGKTHLVITIKQVGRMVVPITFSQTVSAGVTIDWGDGTATATISGTGYKSTSHTYASVGIYDISLDVAVGCVMGLGLGATGYCVMGENTEAGQVYCNMLKFIRVGNRTTLTNYGVSKCYALVNITFPSSTVTTDIGAYLFLHCYSLAFVSIPSGVTYLNSFLFQYCYSLVNVSIPVSVINIYNSVFQYCYALVNVEIPIGVVYLYGYSHADCYGMKNYYVYPTTPPTLTTTSFYNIPSDCVIHVPSASLSAYQSATNWLAHSSKMTGDL